eukprot:jgi/Hompol1/2527/HPOL_006032-RA
MSFWYNRAGPANGPNAGEITFGGINPARVNTTQKPAWLPTLPMTQDTSAWTVSLSAAAVGSQTVATQGTQAIIDSGSTLIILPRAVFNGLNAVVQATLDPNLGVYTFDCGKVATLPPISFTFAGSPHPYVLSAGQQIYYASGSTCAWGLTPTDDTLAIFGVVFMRQFYVTFDFTGPMQIGLSMLPGVPPPPPPATGNPNVTVPRPPSIAPKPRGTAGSPNAAPTVSAIPPVPKSNSAVAAGFASFGFGSLFAIAFAFGSLAITF